MEEEEEDKYNVSSKIQSILATYFQSTLTNRPFSTPSHFVTNAFVSDKLTEIPLHTPLYEDMSNLIPLLHQKELLDIETGNSTWLHELRKSIRLSNDYECYSVPLPIPLRCRDRTFSFIHVYVRSSKYYHAIFYRFH
jgi:hypothetical protein